MLVSGAGEQGQPAVEAGLVRLLPRSTTCPGVPSRDPCWGARRTGKARSECSATNGVQLALHRFKAKDRDAAVMACRRSCNRSSRGCPIPLGAAGQEVGTLGIPKPADRPDRTIGFRAGLGTAISDA